MLTLKKNYDFQKVFKKGTWYGGDLVSMYVLVNHKLSNYLGIAVSKKVSKSSVKRNRIKRLMKAVFRNNTRNILQGYDIVIVWKTNVSYEKATYKNIENDLLKCIKKARLLIKKEDEDAR